MLDPRDEFISTIDLTQSRVRSANSFIFLCGGECKTTQSHPVASVRHAIYLTLTNGRHSRLAELLTLAEDVQDWYRDGIYPDLLTFEEDLASLCSTVVLAVESPGAIAELGAFATIPTIRKRLLTLVAESHYDVDSFITLGPIKKIENIKKTSVLVYDWNRSTNGAERFVPEAILESMDEVTKRVEDAVLQGAGESVFDGSDSGHLMLLICELCRLFLALNESEIATYLNRLGLSIDTQKLKRFIFLLQKLRLLRKKSHGHGRYYHSPSDASLISFGHQGQAPNKDRVQVNVNDYYKLSNRTRATVVSRLRVME